MNVPNKNLILTADGFALRPEHTAHAEEKAAKILRHERPRVHLVRVHVKHEVPHSGAPHFVVRATAEHAGPDHTVHAASEEPITALGAAFAKLERALSELAGIHRQARHVVPEAL